MGGDRKRIIKKMFNLMDANSSGQINEGEALPFLKHVHGSPEKALETWTEMLEKCDKDKNQKIDEAEFIDYYLHVVYAGRNREEMMTCLQQECERYEAALARVFVQGKNKS